MSNVVTELQPSYDHKNLGQPALEITVLISHIVKNPSWHGGGGGGGRGQSDIIIHTYARVQIIEFHNFLGGGGGGVRKMNIFGGMMIL